MIDTRPYCKSLDGKPVAVFGLGLSGMATAKALQASGCVTTVWDDTEQKRSQAESEGLTLYDPFEKGLNGYGGLALSPGIPLHFPEPHPVVRKAEEAGVEILGDIEILYRSMPDLKAVGITGTNGKSTTTALVAHILSACGQKAMAAGNIGQPVLSLDLKDETLILELSSYQLDLCSTFRPEIACLLNFSADHLDRHGGMEGYIAAKERIFEGPGIGICGVDDDHARGVYERIKVSGSRKVIPVSVAQKAIGGVYIKDHFLIDDIDGGQVSVGAVKDLPALPGMHNWQNLCAAYAICRTMGISGEAILAAAKTYPGLPHRQQLIRIINGIPYINDSKATNAEAAAKAIACYNNIFLIAGGRPKEGGLNGLDSCLSRVTHVFLIGEATDDFAAWLEKRGVPFTKSYKLELAIAEAHEMAQASKGRPGDAPTVLLSSACASWDQFRNFEHRGAVFTEIVMALPGEAML